MESKVAGRYAKSLLQLATARSTQDRVYEDMQFISNTATSSHDLALLMKNPIINHDKKIAVIKALFESHVSELSIEFMKQVDTYVR